MSITIYVAAKITPEASARLLAMCKKERRSKSKQIEHLIMEYKKDEYSLDNTT